MASPVQSALSKTDTSIKLVSNYFHLKIPSGNVYHYDVQIELLSHGSDSGRKYRISMERKKEVMDMVLRAPDKFPNAAPVYDGSKNLFTRMRLDIDTQFICSISLESNYLNRHSDKFRVTIRPVQKALSDNCAISLDPLHAFMAGKTNSVSHEAIMVLQTILQFGPSMHDFRINQSFFYPQDFHFISSGKEIWLGYRQSIGFNERKAIVNHRIKTNVFHKKGPVLNYIAEFLDLNASQLSAIGKLRYTDVSNISKELKNIRIKVTHLDYERKYRILNLSQSSSNELELATNQIEEKAKCTVADYFAKNYQPLKYPHLPCIQVHPERKNIFLPVEVCEIIPGQHSQRTLNCRLRAEMSRCGILPPKQRFDGITKSLKRANTLNDRYLKEFEMKVDTEPVALEGRVIEAPELRYQNSTTIKPKDGCWNMRDKKYYSGAIINSWILLSFANEVFCSKRNLETFAQRLFITASEQGIQTTRVKTVKIVYRSRNSVDHILQEILAKYAVDLAVIVLPAKDKCIYGEIKKVADISLGLITQCVTDESVIRRMSNPSVMSNLCQKLNAKMGGINNSLGSVEIPLVFWRPVMIVGLDILHPSLFDEEKYSIAVAVGSLDAHSSKYAVTTSAQTIVCDKRSNNNEVILSLNSMMIDLLKEFYIHNKGRKPENIIIYRAGLCKEKFDAVRQSELPCIRKACTRLDSTYTPGITFIALQKRHHTRFMPCVEKEGIGKMRNIPPGTTIDVTISDSQTDFFLCSHFASQGTSRPCHYSVIEDDNKFTANELQDLTYRLCYTNVRCTKSMSSPAPVQYARLAARRVRGYLSAVRDESREDSQEISFSVMEKIKINTKLKNNMYFV